MKWYLVILLFLFTKTSNSQGSWDIGYILVDSLTNKHIGKSVKLDFKTNSYHRKGGSSRHIRSYVREQDTGYLTIENSSMQFAEIRKMFVDHGSYDEQFLECLGCPNAILRIYNAEILEIDDRAILFMIEIVVSTSTSSEPERIFKKVLIEKTKLDGVMYKLEL